MLQTISVTVIAAAVVIVAIVLIPVILQIRRTAREAEKLFETARMEIVPLSHDLASISREVSGILESIRRDADRIEEGVTAVRDAAGRFRDFEDAALSVLGGPLVKLATLAGAVSQGLGVFLRLFRGTGKE